MSETPPYFTGKAHRVIVDAVGQDQLQWSSFDHDLMNLAREADARIASLESALASATSECEQSRKTIADLREANERMQEALEPFSTFADGAVEKVEGDWYWVNLQNNRICDWFGPSDFGRARAALQGGNDAE